MGAGEVRVSPAGCHMRCSICNRPRPGPVFMQARTGARGERTRDARASAPPESAFRVGDGGVACFSARTASLATPWRAPPRVPGSDTGRARGTRPVAHGRVGYSTWPKTRFRFTARRTSAHTPTPGRRARTLSCAGVRTSSGVASRADLARRRASRYASSASLISARPVGGRCAGA